MRPSLGGFVLLAGAAVFVVLEQLAEASVAGFSPAHDPLSRLGESTAPTRPLWTLAVATLGVAWVVGRWIALGPRPGRLLVALDLVPVAGIGTALAVPLDANLAVHEVAAFIGFLGAILSVVATGQAMAAPWRQACVVLAGLAVLALSPASAVLIDPMGWGGLERLVVAPLVGSMIVVGLAALAAERPLRPPAVRPSARRTAGLMTGVVVLCLLGLGHGLTANGYGDITRGATWVQGGVIRAR